MTFYHFSQLVFDCHEGDIFGCVADIGWITGHSYVVYGPLSNGVTTLLFESTPVYPDPGKCYTWYRVHSTQQLVDVTSKQLQYFI